MHVSRPPGTFVIAARQGAARQHRADPEEWQETEAQAPGPNSCRAASEGRSREGESDYGLQRASVCHSRHASITDRLLLFQARATGYHLLFPRAKTAVKTTRAAGTFRRWRLLCLMALLHHPARVHTRLGKPPILCGLTCGTDVWFWSHMSARTGTAGRYACTGGTIFLSGHPAARD